ncbi:DUF2339 domain-containing protein [Marinicellulosiphila megalodicopiae]|uniref:DUF2339 domain-containing protein n=1 Tax=Marinicellulosiphila megalodicopiae TaxID=2724896 RepID=UPI003BAFBBD3
MLSLLSFIAIFIALAILLVGSILGGVSFFVSLKSRKTIVQLKKEVDTLSKENQSLIAVVNGEQERITDNPLIDDLAQTPILELPSSVKSTPRIALILETWMIWFGVLSITLAGGFLVRYSVEAGVLTRDLGIVCAFLMGGVFHLIAEVLRRNSRGKYQAVSALALSGSILIYFALLSTLHLYTQSQQDPLFIILFSTMAVVSLFTMYMSHWHGTLLAFMGIAGSFLVPAIVGGNSKDLTLILIYCLAVSSCALVLMRQMFKPWIWWITLIGALMWWGISMLMKTSDYIWHSSYLTIVAYLFLSVRSKNYLLIKSWSVFVEENHHLSFWQKLFHRSPMQGSLIGSMVLISIAQVISFNYHPMWEYAVLNWMPFIMLMFWVARFNTSLRMLPWFVLISFLVAIFFMQTDSHNLAQQILNMPSMQLEYIGQFVCLLAVLFFCFSIYNYSLVCKDENRQRLGEQGLIISLALMAPVLCLAIGYLKFSVIHGSYYWSLTSFSLGLIYAICALWQLSKKSESIATVWLVIAAHCAFSLAAVIAFKQASLTMALAMQIIVLVMLNRWRKLEYIPIFIKILLAIVISRLTFSPWIFSYGTDTHWSLWTYGGCFLMIIWASIISHDYTLKRWLEVSAIHVFVLFINIEIRYWIYPPGQIFDLQYGFIEAAMNTNLFAALGLMYRSRLPFARQLYHIYKTISVVLMSIALVNFAFVVSLLNPLLVEDGIGKFPILNWLLMGFGLPIFLFWLAGKYIHVIPKVVIYFATSVSVFVLINLQIRHIWHKQLNLYDPLLFGEIYTYSTVWMLFALSIFIVGVIRNIEKIYTTGMTLIAVVMLKIFLMDMADLTGLWRIVSFMGLGISLLSMAYLHQWIKNKNEKILEEQGEILIKV